MSFNELVKQSLKTKEQIIQEKQEAQTQFINEQKENAINYVLELIKKNIIYMAETGNTRGNAISNTVIIPSVYNTYSDEPKLPTEDIFEVKYETDNYKSGGFFSFCRTKTSTMTVEKVEYLIEIFEKVKKRAEQDNINVSVPFIFIEIVDYNNTQKVIKRKKVFIQRNKLFAKAVTKTYGKGYSWEGETAFLNLAVDYDYII